MKRIINVKTGYIKRISDKEEIPNGWTDKMPPTEFVKPVWDENLGDWVEGATEEDIRKIEEMRVFEQFENFRDLVRSLGEQFFKEIEIRETAELYGQPAEVVNPAVEELNEKVLPVMNLIKGGNWYSAMIEMGKITPPTNEIAKRVWDVVMGKVYEVVNTYYR